MQAESTKEQDEPTEQDEPENLEAAEIVTNQQVPKEAKQEFMEVDLEPQGEQFEDEEEEQNFDLGPLLDDDGQDEWHQPYTKYLKL